MKVSKTPALKNSIIATCVPANYSDVFTAGIEKKYHISPDELQIAFWTDMPGWVNSLFKLRNWIVKPFGLKAGTKNFDEFKNAIKTGTNYKFFSISGKSENEMVILLTDKHLNVYLSVFIADVNTDFQKVYVSTVVHFNNWLGYAYFYTILPFHCIVVKGTIKHALKKLKKQKSLTVPV